MKKIYFLLLILFIAGIGFAQEITLPHISLKDLKGMPVHLDRIDSSKHPVVFSFWATWCVPCLKEMSSINDEMDDWKEQSDFQFYAVSVDDTRSQQKVGALVNGKGWDLDVLLDVNSDLKRFFNATLLPYVVIVYKNKIAYSNAGYLPNGEEKIYAKIKELTSNE